MGDEWLKTYWVLTVEVKKYEVDKINFNEGCVHFQDC